MTEKADRIRTHLASKLRANGIVPKNIPIHFVVSGKRWDAVHALSKASLGIWSDVGMGALAAPGELQSDSSGRTPDFSNPVKDERFKIDAAKALPPLLDRLSKLRGADMRPIVKGPDEDYVREEVAYVQQLIDERKEAQDKLLELQDKILELTSVEAEVIS